MITTPRFYHLSAIIYHLFGVKALILDAEFPYLRCQWLHG